MAASAVLSFTQKSSLPLSPPVGSGVRRARRSSPHFVKNIPRLCGIRWLHPRRVRAAVFEITPATAEARDRSNRRSQRYCAAESKSLMESVAKSERFGVFQVLSHVSTALEQNIYCTFRSINTSLSHCVQSCLSKKRRARKTEHRRKREGLFFPACSVEAPRWSGPVLRVTATEQQSPQTRGLVVGSRSSVCP